MSTFNGKIEEIPEISVDRFDGENVNSLIYFLSHCHTDHMVGLNDWNFQKSLTDRPNIFLYVSPISKKILIKLYPSIESKLKELCVYSPTLIKIPDDKNGDTLSVTPLPAGHCPGSVMFLFECNKTILYTGDYRAHVNDLRKYRAFYSLDYLKKIDSLYLDTTFLKLSFSKFPSRKESIDKICEIIKEWVGKSIKHLIKIVLTANYGFEYLFIEIAKVIKMPIHINAEAYRFYKCIPEMDQAITINSNKTQIHAGCGKCIKEICIIDDTYVRTIKPSALWWQNKNSEDIAIIHGDYRVCYSSHASLEEITDFLIFIKPSNIIPCVVPKNENDKEDMLSLIQNIKQTYNNQPHHESKVKLFEYKALTSKPQQNDDDSLDNLLDSPTKFKRKRFSIG